MFLQFATNAATIALRYQLTSANTTVFSNFPPIGFSGCDLYRWDDGNSTWRWVSSSFNGVGAAPGKNGLAEDIPLLTDTVGWPVGPPSPYATLNSTYRYRLHFPSYNGVTMVSVGVAQGASLTPDVSWNNTGYLPVLYYGTSIAQGGLSPRPGDTFVNRLSRSLPSPVYNFGFCGACRMELSVASLLVTVPTSVFVIDCGHNMAPSLIANNTVPFVTFVRQSIPSSVPIVLVEPTDYRPTWIQTDAVYNVSGRRAELALAFQRLVQAGVANLRYVPGDTLYAGADSEEEELAYEGIHPLDRGHNLMYHALEQVLKPLVLGDGAPVEASEWQAHKQVNDARLLQLAEATAVAVSNSTQSGVYSLGEQHLLHGFTSEAPVRSASADSLTWMDANSLVVRGRAFDPSVLPGTYTRLPTAAHGVVRDAVWGLSLDSAGISVGFTSNSPSIWINYTASNTWEPMSHFSVAGMSGLDLWAWDDASQKWRFAAASNLPYGVRTVVQALTPPLANLTDPSGADRKYMLFFPTYNQAVSVAVGVEQGSSLQPYDPLPSRTAAAPIVWYGTSILQGGVSLKVGNIFTSAVSRALNREVFNYGFSGNGIMEISVAQFLVTLPASVFIIDCVWNMEPASITNNTIPLVQYIRAHAAGGATLPIVLAEGTPFGRNWAVPAADQHQQQDSAALYAAYSTLIASGDKNLYYMPSSALFGVDAFVDSATGNALHPTDAGMHDVAVGAWMPFLQKLLG